MTLELIQGLLLAFALVVILMPPYIRMLRHFGFGEADPRGRAREPQVKGGTPTMGGLLIIGVVVTMFVVLRWPVGGRGHRPARDARVRRPARRGGRLPQCPHGRGDPRPPEAAVADGGRHRRGVADPEHLRAVRVPGAVRRRRDHRSLAVRRVRRLRDRRGSERREHHGRPRRPGGRDAGVRVRLVPDHRPAQRARAAQHGLPVRPDHRRACSGSCGSTSIRPRCSWATRGRWRSGATLAVIALITGQILVLPLIGLIFVVETASDIIQIGYFKLLRRQRVFRMSPIHHHFELGGWDEEKITLRFWIVGDPRRAAGRHAVPGLDQCAALSMTARRPAGHRCPDARRRARRRACGSAGHRARARPQRDLARTVPRRCRGAGDRLRRPTGRRSWRRRSSSWAIAAVSLRLGPEVEPAVDVGGCRPGHDLALDQPGLPDDGAAAACRGSAALVDARAAGDPAGPGPGQRVGSVPPPVPGTHGRGDRHQGQDHDRVPGRTRSWPRIRSTRPSSAATSACPWSSACRELTPDHRVVVRAVRAAAAHPLARDDGGGVHERDLGPSRPPRLAWTPTGASSAGWPSWWTRTARWSSTWRTRSSAATRGWARLPPSCTGTIGRCPGGWASWMAGSWPRPWSGCRSPGAGSRRPGRAAGSCRSTSSRIPGRHNVSNALAAIAVGLLFGVAPDAIRRAAAAFTGVEHRLESVALVDGVRFVNDSQGTQPDAVIAALRAFPPPIVLIAGGRDKGVDLDRACPAWSRRRRSRRCSSGRAARRWTSLFRGAGLGRTAHAGTMEDAVRHARTGSPGRRWPAGRRERSGHGRC